MKEHPILMSDEMVRAILDGRKVQHRVPLRRQPLDIMPMNVPNQWLCLMERNPNRGLVFDCRYGIPGDRLWVREAFYAQSDLWESRGPQPIHYRANTPDARQVEDYVCHPSIHMPRWASRITLEITDVRVERVQDITEADAFAEWVGPAALGDPDDPLRKLNKLVAGFALLWNALYAKRGLGWEVNPWVWVLTFRQVEPSCTTT